MPGNHDGSVNNDHLNENVNLEHDKVLSNMWKKQKFQVQNEFFNFKCSKWDCQKFHDTKSSLVTTRPRLNLEDHFLVDPRRPTGDLFVSPSPLFALRLPLYFTIHFVSISSWPPHQKWGPSLDLSPVFISSSRAPPHLETE